VAPTDGNAKSGAYLLTFNDHFPMKKLFQMTAFAIAPLLLVGCGKAAEHPKEPIAIINEAHGYADIYTPERFETLQEERKKFLVFVSADW